MSSRLTRLLAPRNIAVIGGREAGHSIRQSRKLGFEGRIHVVNPNRSELEGIRCVASVADLPEVPDAAFVAVPREATIKAVEELARIGAGGAVCYASGFAEVQGDGPAQQQALADAAGEMPVIGPNCYGTLNYIDGVALWPDVQGGRRAERGVAIVTQSGNLAINLTLQSSALDIAHLITVGNQAVVDVTECIEALVEDPRVTAIGLIIEGIADVPRFAQAAEQALRKGMPLAAIKLGRTEDGAKAAMTHSGTLAGQDRLYDALFQRYGIHRSDGLPDLMEALKALSILGPLEGGRIATMSCSGGEAVMAADAVRDLNLTLPALTPEHAAEVRETLSEFVHVANPLDYHTFIWGDVDAMHGTYSAMMRGGFDVTALIFDHPREGLDEYGEWAAAEAAFIKAAEATGAKAAVISNLYESQPEDAARALIACGIAPLRGIQNGLKAIEACAHVGDRARTVGTLPPTPKPSTSPYSPETLDEWAAKSMLATYGLKVPDNRAVSICDAPTAARDLGFPVVLKALGSSLSHKTELGAVALGLSSCEAVQLAAERMRPLSDRCLIETMVTEAVAELIVGVDWDPQFGLYLVLGAGGVLVELLEDTAVLMLPTDRTEIETALASLKVSKLLDGWRGRPKGDFAAAVDAVLAIARFSEDHRDRLAELDVNPLMILPEGCGAIVADALIRMQPDNR